MIVVGTVCCVLKPWLDSISSRGSHGFDACDDERLIRGIVVTKAI